MMTSGNLGLSAGYAAQQFATVETRDRSSTARLLCGAVHMEADGAEYLAHAVRRRTAHNPTAHISQQT
jgi:hypothetical protein